MINLQGPHAMSLTCTTYVATLANMTVNSNVTEANFAQILPSAIDYGEQRCYRELDLLAIVTRAGIG